jgi:hypothetical protein
MPWSQRNRHGQTLLLEAAALRGRQNAAAAPVITELFSSSVTGQGPVNLTSPDEKGSLIKAQTHDPRVGVMTGAAGRLTILFSRRWAEGGYLRCPYNREGGILGVG